MARRPKNQTIGTVTCPFCHEPAAVRKERGGKLYFVSSAGKITPYTDVGQGWILDNGTIWGDAEPPPGIPDWITGGRAGPKPTESVKKDVEPAEITEDIQPATGSSTDQEEGLASDSTDDEGLLF